MTARSCATCRHLTTHPEDRHIDEVLQPHRFICGVLFVVKNHRWQMPFWPGDIITWSQAQSYQLNIEPLVILDPERTETTDNGKVIREGVEPFACSAWNVDEHTMPNRWQPVAAYDMRWNPFLGRYVRRRERRAA